MQPNPHRPAETRAVDLEIRVTTPWGRGGQRLEFVVHSPSGVAGFHQETVPGDTLNSPERFQKQILEQLESLHRGCDVEQTPMPRRDVLQELETIGHDLYRMLFPRPMRAIYREVAPKVQTLLITSDEPWIPWELLRPYELEDDDFLCMRFQMSRWLTGDVPLAFERCIDRILCVEPGGGPELGAVPNEWQALQELAQESPGVEATLQRDPDLHAAMRFFEKEPFDLLHLAGHGAHDRQRPSEAKVLLSEGALRARHLSPAAEKKLRVERPIVFFNSCEVGRLGQGLTNVDGWAERWVRRCGCAAFLAPMWAVRDQRAARFSQLFYHYLSDGQTLGQAVLSTRHVLRKEQPGDMAWLAYSLYGAPTARVVFGKRLAEPRVAEIPRKLVPPPPQPPSSEQIREIQRHGESRTDSAPQRKDHVLRSPAQRHEAQPSLRAQVLASPLFRYGLGLAVLASLALVIWFVVVTRPKANPKTDGEMGSQSLMEVNPAEDGTLQEVPGDTTGDTTGDQHLPDDAAVKLQPSQETLVNVASRAPTEPAPREVALPPTTPEPRLPLATIVPGKVAVLVLDSSTGDVDSTVAAAARAAINTNKLPITAISPLAPRSEIAKLLQADYSAIPMNQESPWGAEYLLLISSSRRPLPTSAPHIQSVSLSLDAQLLSTRDSAITSSAFKSATGSSTSISGALNQAAERCLATIIFHFSNGSSP